MLCSKTVSAIWFPEDEQRSGLDRGFFEKPSACQSSDGALLFVGVGDVLFAEAEAARALMHKHCPTVAVRTAAIVSPSELVRASRERRDEGAYMSLFDSVRAVVAGVAGYVASFHDLFLWHRSRMPVTVLGYRDALGHATDFGILFNNGASRYHFILAAVRQLKDLGLCARTLAPLEEYALTCIRTYPAQASQLGRDPDWIRADAG
jgi:phosphoketolase